METDVARKIEDSIATVEGVKHIYTMVQSGTVTVTVEFRLEIPTQEALDGVRDAVSRVRSAAGRPARSGDRESQPVRRADPDLHRRLQPDGRRGAVVVRRQHRREAPALRARRGRSRARRRRRPRGARRARSRADAGAQCHCGGHLPPIAADPAGSLRRPRRHRRRRAVGAHDRHRAVGRGARAHGRRALRRPPRALDQLAAVSDTVAERRSAALLDGKPVVGFEIVRSRGAGEVDVADGVRAELAS